MTRGRRAGVLLQTAVAKNVGGMHMTVMVEFGAKDKFTKPFRSF